MDLIQYLPTVSRVFPQRAGFERVKGSGPAHWHDAHELVFVLRGKLSIRYCRGDVSLDAGDMLLIQGLGIHRLLSEDGALLLVIRFFSEVLSPFTSDYKRLRFRSSAVSGKQPKSATLHRSAARIADECTKRQDGFEYAVAGSLYTLLGLLFRHGVVSFDTTPDLPAFDLGWMRLTEIIDFVRDNYDKRIDQNEAAALTLRSVSSLRRALMSCAGMTFARYLSLYRVSQAQKLLCSSERPLPEIAALCGFDSLASLHRAFKLNNGESPKSFKERLADAPRVDIARGLNDAEMKEAVSLISSYL